MYIEYEDKYSPQLEKLQQKMNEYQNGIELEITFLKSFI